ncbi:ABC transporter ATP-binding protein [Niameybacter massiliensis]|uniref:ABC transporter ATP-binding protein n=1 Tax=Holtiella tumoricola TaxID=3018743 RepID=A0AA42DN08_9FIRM|nr:ABC transporter ATP-binding protein [Holtiella tumoricola]MDA3732010.1 ABC transporter ATP-binding protein [Holtiella tumoricola]
MGIVLRQVSKVYKTGEVETSALKDIDLTIKEGEVLIVLGPSGSGKSTLLNVMSGLDTPSAGEMYYNDLAIHKLDQRGLTKFRRKYLGFIFQQYNLLQNLSVKENIEMGAALSDHPLSIDEVMDAVGLTDKAKKYPSQLSGGEQQRVAIARSVVKNPAVLFCDEPTGALDEKTACQVLELLEKMNDLYHTTIVIITHNPSIALMGDRVIKMNSGIIHTVYENVDKKRVGEIKWG